MTVTEMRYSLVSQMVARGVPMNIAIRDTEEAIRYIEGEARQPSQKAIAALRRAPDMSAYRGLSVGQCDDEARALCAAAASTGQWARLAEHLNAIEAARRPIA